MYSTRGTRWPQVEFFFALERVLAAAAAAAAAAAFVGDNEAHRGGLDVTFFSRVNTRQTSRKVC